MYARPRRVPQEGRRKAEKMKREQDEEEEERTWNQSGKTGKNYTD